MRGEGGSFLLLVAMRASCGRGGREEEEEEEELRTPTEDTLLDAWGQEILGVEDEPV